VTWAGAFLDDCCYRVMRSRLEAVKKVARMLRAHKPLLLNSFQTKRGDFRRGRQRSEQQIRVITRRSYGFRTYDPIEITLYHKLGSLPEPE
jgi:transposase